MLKRFWFRFGRSSKQGILDFGCGITAYDLSDAQRILHEKVFPIYGEGTIEQINEDIDVRTLDANHVRPNMGNPALRGVWFPLI